MIHQKIRADLIAPPVERKRDGSLYGLTPEQHRRARGLLRQCMNYMDGECLMIGGACAQAARSAVCCRWFRWAVLEAPANMLLKEEIFGGSEAHKRCEICGAKFKAAGNRAKYCTQCGKKVRRERQRGYMREKRG